MQATFNANVTYEVLNNGKVEKKVFRNNISRFKDEGNRYEYRFYKEIETIFGEMIEEFPVLCYASISELIEIAHYVDLSLLYKVWINLKKEFKPAFARVTMGCIMAKDTCGFGELIDVGRDLSIAKQDDQIEFINLVNAPSLVILKLLAYVRANREEFKSSDITRSVPRYTVNHLGHSFGVLFISNNKVIIVERDNLATPRLFKIDPTMDFSLIQGIFNSHAKGSKNNINQDVIFGIVSHDTDREIKEINKNMDAGKELSKCAAFVIK